MLILALRYLNGWAMAAADGARKEQAEWPPHPDRLFMALAAAWFETGEDPAEGMALRWLETLDPPEIAASDAEIRRPLGNGRPLVSYVPVNDVRTARKLPIDSDLGKLRDAGLAVLPELRSRRPRGFPVAIPHDPKVHFIWPQTDPGEHRSALERLAHKLTRVGHSASLVQAWLTEEAVDTVWVPIAGVAQHRLRVPTAGRLDYLKRRCNRDAVLAYTELAANIDTAKGRDKSRLKEGRVERFGEHRPVTLRPDPGRWQGYARPVPAPTPEVPGSVFDPNLIVLALSGKRLSLPATLKLTEALRGALMAACPEQQPPEWFSGHASDGRPSRDPHLALFPLPFVGAEHADGRLIGLGLALPVGLNPQAAARCLSGFLHETESGLPRRTRLFDGKWVECAVEPETRESSPANLRVQTWVRPSRTWASVTPVVLDRHYDGADKWARAAEDIREACSRIGLPRPSEVLLHPVSLFEGVPHAREFPRMVRKSDGGLRHHSHAVIVFDEQVRGPVLVGAGRFRGYGLCRPADQGEAVRG